MDQAAVPIPAIPAQEEGLYSRFVARPARAVWRGLHAAWSWTYQYFTQESSTEVEMEAEAEAEDPPVVVHQRFAPLTGYGAAVGAMGLRFLVDVIGITLISAVSDEEDASAIVGTGLTVLFLVLIPTAMMLYRFQPILSDGYKNKALLKPWTTALMATVTLSVVSTALLVPSKQLLEVLQDDPHVIEGATLLIHQYLYTAGPLFFLSNVLGVITASATESSQFDVIANGLRAVALLSSSAWYLTAKDLEAIRGFATAFSLAGAMLPAAIHTGLLFYKHRDKLHRMGSCGQLAKESLQDSYKLLYAAAPYAGSAIFETGSFVILFNVLAASRGVETLKALNGYATIRALFVLPLGLAGQYKLNLAIYLQACQKDLKKMQQVTRSYLRTTVLWVLMGSFLCIGIAPYLSPLYHAEKSYFSRANMALWCAGIVFDTLESVGEGWLRGINKSLIGMGMNALAFAQFPIYCYLLLEREVGFKSFPLAYCLSQLGTGIGSWLLIQYYLKYRLPQQYKIDELPLQEVGEVLQLDAAPVLQIERPPVVERESAETAFDSRLCRIVTSV